MTVHDILEWMNAHQDLKMKKIYTRSHQTFDALGIKMQDLRQLAKTIGIDNELACKLQDIHLFETMMLSTLICDPNKLSIEQLSNWASRAESTSIIDQGLSDVILNIDHCDELCNMWLNHENIHLRYAGYATLSAYFRLYPLEKMNHLLGVDSLMMIKNNILNEPLTVQNAMNNAVVMAGLHVPQLVNLAKEVADHIGYILPLKAKNSCNIQSASDYLKRYINQPKFSRVARLEERKKS
ncbi:MAG TPA: DNA alkylation repair protein [Acholeplasmataceae bacterium]|nr:DNA alkylation repair protein [Acholeplasmataceae bacterium]